MKRKIRTLREVIKIYKHKTKDRVQRWIDGSAEYGFTTQKNINIFRSISLIPRVLKEIKKVDISSNFFGKKISSPIIICPMGGLTQFNKKAEFVISEASEELNLIYFFPDNTAYELNDICKNKKHFLQAYFHLDNDEKFWKMRIKSAEKLKVSTIGINVDSPIRPISYNKSDTGYDARKHYYKLPKYYFRKKSSPLNWKTIEKIRRFTKKPIILKGILSVEDAVKAQSLGINGIWISNHGGRNLETDLTSVEQLPLIKKRTKKKLKIIIDGGIRTGTDIIKCLSLGADYVAIGRPILYGLIADKKNGPRRVLELFIEELKTSLRLCGVAKIKNLSTKNIKTNL